MCIYPRLNIARGSPRFAALPKRRSASCSSLRTPLPTSARYPKCLSASGTPRAAMSRSISICASPSSSASASSTYPASRSRSRRRGGSEGTLTSPSASAASAIRSATGNKYTRVARSHAASIRVNDASVSSSSSSGTNVFANRKPRPRSTRSPAARRASREPISAAANTAAAAHALGEASAGCVGTKTGAEGSASAKCTSDHRPSGSVSKSRSSLFFSPSRFGRDSPIRFASSIRGSG
mmetsp:Transcript_1169/g.4919  ORF Transcript_1169/g.4919 Transcript_1169/m.4919 type:complete len:238 (+) Transcript_1169:1978-2691(+)